MNNNRRTSCLSLHFFSEFSVSLSLFRFKFRSHTSIPTTPPPLLLWDTSHADCIGKQKMDNSISPNETSAMDHISNDNATNNVNDNSSIPAPVDAADIPIDDNLEESSSPKSSHSQYSPEFQDAHGTYKHSLFGLVPSS